MDQQGTVWKYQIVSADAIGAYAKAAGIPSESLQKGAPELRWQPYYLKAMLGRGSQVAVESWSIRFRPLQIEWTALLAMVLEQYQKWPDQFPLAAKRGGLRLSRKWRAPTGGTGKEEVRWHDTVEGPVRFGGRCIALIGK